jgi:glycosyltransferase involved in cell wall biosynthesis
VEHCDIIIPTHNNARLLPRTLNALYSQRIPPSWQITIILCDDGSRDNTVQVAARLKKQSPWNMHLIARPHTQGPGAARNDALSIARGTVVVFLGADIVLLPRALFTHLSFHTRQRRATWAALGQVKWDPALKPTPLMEWLVHGGPQNDFDGLLGKNEADPAHYFYGSHLSLKRSILPHPAFAQELTGYGWEDLDLGRRLKSKNMHLQVLPDAMGLHHHRYHVKDVRLRQRRVGTALVIYQQRYPAVELLPKHSRVHRILRWIVLKSGGTLLLAGLVRLAEALNISAPRLYARFCAAEFWAGVINVPKTFHI